ncbi:MAG: TraM recognition domain-containing protein, partial [Pseudomonadota bacterium]
MAIDKKYEYEHKAILRDVRPFGVRVADGMSRPNTATAIFFVIGAAIYINEWALAVSDILIFFMFLYYLWLKTVDRSLAFKLPMDSPYVDKNNMGPGKSGKPEGILYLGNVDETNEEVWFSNSDIRTHILYLGTTGAGKTEGLKSLVTNTMCWGSGFVYVDGKADTDLWSSLSALLRRFGRDDDLLVLNYMTGNSDVAAPSNTMNPFSSGSASYLTNMLVSLMPESGGDNAMWAERAVSLVGAMMPVLTWKRDNQEMPLSVRTIRDYLAMNKVIALARDEAVPMELRSGITGYLDTLPGFVHDAYDDNGDVKPPGPDTPQYDTTTANQQHGYLAMQFTRSLQSLGDDYGYIFDTQAADVDMVDVVLQRRILVVLVPALEKSGDEVANLGKIVAASIKGMMGSALGSTVEGESSTVIENKPTHSSTPFMTVFDEVGYYVAEGMAVMAAQARSLGFCLVFAGQDLPAMKKRVREEANSITANCNLKIFGKLEDPTETKEFFEKTVGSAIVTEVSGFQMAGGSEFGSYYDTQQAGIQLRPRASYEELRSFKEGQAVVTFGEAVVSCKIFYANPGFAKAMRVTRFMSLPPPDDNTLKHAGAITKLRDLMINKTWTAERADVAIETPQEVKALNTGYDKAEKAKADPVDAGISGVVEVHALTNDLPDAPPPPPKEEQKAPPVEQPKPATETPKAAPPQETPKSETPPPVQDTPKENPPETPQEKPPEASPVQTETEDEPSDEEKSSGDSKSGGSAGPMGFFSKKKEAAPDVSKDTPAPQEKAPKKPVSEAPAVPETPSAQPEQKDESGGVEEKSSGGGGVNPMGFFKKGGSSEAQKPAEEKPADSPKYTPEKTTPESGDKKSADDNKPLPDEIK